MATSETYPISLWIKYANISQYLSRNGNSMQNIMQWGIDRGKQRLPFLLGYFADIVNWVNTNAASDTNLPLVATYMFSLCGSYIPVAETIAGNNGGSVINPIVPVTESNITPIVESFIVGGTGDLIGNGGTTITLPFANIIPNSIQVVIDNSVVIPGLTDRQSYTITYGTSNCVLTFTVPAATGQAFFITGWRTQT